MTGPVRFCLSAALALIMLACGVTAASGAALEARLAVDGVPGPSGFAPSGLGEFQGQLYFEAEIASTGREIYRLEGRRMVLLSDIWPGPETSNPGPREVLGNLLFFRADDGVNGSELWKSDGTTTSMVSDLNPGPDSSNPTAFAAMGSHLYLSAYTPATGTELFRTDGNSIELVKDINPGTDGSNPGDSTTLGNRIIFRASTAALGTEPWTSDGTTTANIANLNAGGNSSFPSDFTEMGGWLYFGATATGIGSLAGTLLVTRLNGRRNRGRIVLMGLSSFAVLIVIYGLSSTLWLSILAISMVGFGYAVASTMNDTLIQLKVDDRYRGRVMAAYSTIWGFSPAGGLLAGLMANYVGLQWAVALNGFIVLAYVVFLWFCTPMQRID